MQLFTSLFGSWPARADDEDTCTQICAPFQGNSSQTPPPGTPQQLPQYCQAFNATTPVNGIEWALFAMDVATAATCGVACAAAQTGYGAALTEACSIAGCVTGAAEFVDSLVMTIENPQVLGVIGVVMGGVGAVMGCKSAFGKADIKKELRRRTGTDDPILAFVLIMGPRFRLAMLGLDYLITRAHAGWTSAIPTGAVPRGAPVNMGGTPTQIYTTPANGDGVSVVWGSQDGGNTLVPIGTQGANGSFIPLTPGSTEPGPLIGTYNIEVPDPPPATSVTSAASAGGSANGASAAQAVTADTPPPPPPPATPPVQPPVDPDASLKQAMQQAVDDDDTQRLIDQGNDIVDPGKNMMPGDPNYVAPADPTTAGAGAPGADTAGAGGTPGAAPGGPPAGAPDASAPAPAGAPDASAPAPGGGADPGSSVADSGSDATGAADDAAAQTPGSAKDKQFGACVSAVMFAAMAGMRLATMIQSENSRKSTCQKVLSLGSTAPTATASPSPLPTYPSLLGDVSPGASGGGPSGASGPSGTTVGGNPVIQSVYPPGSVLHSYPTAHDELACAPGSQCSAATDGGVISRAQMQDAIAGQASQLLRDPDFKSSALNQGAGALIAQLGGEGLGNLGDGLSTIANGCQASAGSAQKLVAAGYQAPPPRPMAKVAAGRSPASAGLSGGARAGNGATTQEFGNRANKSFYGRRGDIWHTGTDMNIFQIISSRIAADNRKVGP